MTHEQQRSTRTGAVTLRHGRLPGALLLAGAVVSIVANLVHPVLADPGAVSQMFEVHVTEIWTLVHVGLMVGILTSAAGFVTTGDLAASRGDGGLARVGSVFTIAGGTMLAIALGALDGYGISVLAANWRDATGDERALVETQGATIAAINHGIMALGTLAFLGLGLVSHALAFLRSRLVPLWLAATTLVLGAAGVAVGVLLMVSGPTVFAMNDVFRPFTALTTLYFIVLGLALWRRQPVAQPARSTGVRSSREGTWATE